MGIDPIFSASWRLQEDVQQMLISGGNRQKATKDRAKIAGDRRELYEPLENRMNPLHRDLGPAMFSCVRLCLCVCVFCVQFPTNASDA